MGIVPILFVLAFAAKPQITAEQRAKFWRAQAEAIAAQRTAERAAQTAKQIEAELARTCGDARLVIGQDGEPACQPKPKPEPGTAEK